MPVRSSAPALRRSDKRPAGLLASGMLRIYLLVGLGSFLGGVARYAVSSWMAVRWGEVFPWGTLTVNVAGSLAIGILAGLGEAERVFASAEARQFLLVGLLGGFTTFSAFSLQTLRLVQQSQWFYAGANIVGSVIFCLVAVAAGYRLAQAWAG